MTEDCLHDIVTSKLQPEGVDQGQHWQAFCQLYSTARGGSHCHTRASDKVQF